MKRAFTLVELLVVIAVLAILMSYIFKLSKLGNDTSRRTETIARLQRLENCLSGYYAAFGNYPAVQLHATRDITQRVGSHGQQTDQTGVNLWGWNNVGERSEVQAWKQVEAACRAQPVDCRFPFPENYDLTVELVSEEMKELISSGDYDSYFASDPDKKARLLAGFDDGVTRNISRHSANKNKKDWQNIQLFKFGLMSFLLPRYMVMMNGDRVFFDEYAQWTSNNDMPSNPFTGERFSSWTQLRESATNEGNQSDLAKVANIPSQAVCQRWMPNLKEICAANRDIKLFGIQLRDRDYWTQLRADNFDIEIFSPGDAESSSTAGQYILDSVTVLDGWNHEFFYYSPSPYQRYTLWSAGKNGRTFPPWIDRQSKSLEGRARECIAKWVEDDIIHMSN